MPLFVANISKQTHDLLFWIGENKSYFSQKIRPGEQVSVYPQGSRSDHEFIVEQHRQYGIKNINEIDRTKEFVGLCFQFDKSIPLDRLQSTFAHNDDVMMEASRSRRMEATLSMDDMLKKVSQETDSKMSNFEVDIEELSQKGVDKQVDETYIVDGPTDAAPARRGRPRREA